MVGKNVIMGYKWYLHNKSGMLKDINDVVNFIEIEFINIGMNNIKYYYIILIILFYILYIIICVCFNDIVDFIL